MLTILFTISCSKKEFSIAKAETANHSSNDVPVIKQSKTPASWLKFDSKQKFNELFISNEEKSIVTAINNKAVSSEKSNLQEFTTLLSLRNNKNINSYTYDSEDFELVPFDEIAAVLNKNYEVQIENKVYKITRFGTFEFESSKYKRVIEILDGLVNTGFE